MTTTTTITASFKKLRDGSWGITAKGNLPASGLAGQYLRVEKKSGELNTVYVDRVLWTDGAVAICTICTMPRTSPAQKASPAPSGGICDECERPRRGLVDASDSSGIPGRVCPQCAAMPADELSFA